MIKVIAIKDEAAGNESVGSMWQETKIFNATDSLLEVMRWVKDTKKKVTLTIPENSLVEFQEELNNIPF